MITNHVTDLLHITGLQILDLSNNQLEGGFRRAVGLEGFARIGSSWQPIDGDHSAGTVGLEGVATIGLYSNQLEGTIPRELSALKELQQLYLHDNQLNGTIPRELSALKELQQWVFTPTN